MRSAFFRRTFLRFVSCAFLLTLATIAITRPAYAGAPADLNPWTVPVYPMVLNSETTTTTSLPTTTTTTPALANNVGALGQVTPPADDESDDESTDESTTDNTAVPSNPLAFTGANSIHLVGYALLLIGIGLGLWWYGGDLRRRIFAKRSAAR